MVTASGEIRTGRLTSSGMFLWVHLVVEELRGCYSDWDLKESAESLPKGLEAA